MPIIVEEDSPPIFRMRGKTKYHIFHYGENKSVCGLYQMEIPVNHNTGAKKITRYGSLNKPEKKVCGRCKGHFPELDFKSKS